MADPAPPTSPTCPACRYSLDGVPGSRCPECGGQFDPAALASPVSEPVRLQRNPAILTCAGAVTIPIVAAIAANAHEVTPYSPLSLWTFLMQLAGSQLVAVLTPAVFYLLWCLPVMVGWR